MNVQCKLCSGKGKIPDPKYTGGPMRICGMYGEQCLDLECDICCGTGWVGIGEKVESGKNFQKNSINSLC